MTIWILSRGKLRIQIMARAETKQKDDEIRMTKLEGITK